MRNFTELNGTNGSVVSNDQVWDSLDLYLNDPGMDSLCLQRGCWEDIKTGHLPSGLHQWVGWPPGLPSHCWGSSQLGSEAGQGSTFLGFQASWRDGVRGREMVQSAKCSPQA